MTDITEQVAIGFLAGGQARRMGGGDKASLGIGQKTILQRQLAATAAFQTRIINANGAPERFDETGLKIIPDCVSGFLGPLVGVLSCLNELAEHHPHITHLQSCATDAPFIPQDMTARMVAARDAEHTALVQPVSEGRRHPVFTIWPLHLRDDLHQALIHEGVRKIDDFTAAYSLTTVEFASDPVDPFMNVNRPEDRQQAEQLALLLD